MPSTFIKRSEILLRYKMTTKEIKETALVATKYKDKLKFMSNPDEQLANLLDCYMELKPNIASEYSRLDYKKAEEVYTLDLRSKLQDTKANGKTYIPIPRKYDLSELKHEAETIPEEATHNYISMANNIFYANKVTHQIRDAEEKLIYEVFKLKGFKINYFKNGQKQELDPTEKGKEWLFGLTFKRLHEYFKLNPEDSSNARQIVEQEKRLRKSGLDASKLRVFENIKIGNTSVSIRDMAVASKEAMALKDMYIEQFIKEITHPIDNERKAEYDTVNWGMSKDDKGNDIFVIDIPFWQQFSVHVKNQALAAQIQPYPYPIYEKENILITNFMPSVEKHLRGDIDTETIDELKRLGSDRYAHMVLVKRGATKEQFARYYNVDNPIEVVKKPTVRSKDDDGSR